MRIAQHIDSSATLLGSQQIMLEHGQHHIHSKTNNQQRRLKLIYIGRQLTFNNKCQEVEQLQNELRVFLPTT
jgi:hypothetical protein